MTIWKRRGISLIAALGLGLAAPLALAGCEQDEGIGDEIEDAGEDLGNQMEEAGEEIRDEVDDAT